MLILIIYPTADLAHLVRLLDHLRRLLILLIRPNRWSCLSGLTADLDRAVCAAPRAALSPALQLARPLDDQTARPVAGCQPPGQDGVHPRHLPAPCGHVPQLPVHLQGPPAVAPLRRMHVAVAVRCCSILWKCNCSAACMRLCPPDVQLLSQRCRCSLIHVQPFVQ